jgi:hypothetical protein
LSRRFIAGTATLAARLDETAKGRDFDGRYRVDDFFCQDDAWQIVLKRLARDSDAVLMDLRGFQPDNRGCVFEINEILDVVPLDRVVFVVDDTTDMAFLRETLARGWEAVAAHSPNLTVAAPRVTLFQFTGEASVRGLLAIVARAVGSKGSSAQESPLSPQPTSLATH